MAKKGELMLKILEYIGDRAVDIYDIFEAQLAAGYSASFGKLEYEHNKRERKRENQRLEIKERRENQRQFLKYVSRLKQDGLLFKDKDKQISLTPKGKEKIKKLKSKLPNTRFEKNKSLKVVIVSFDIPEIYRRERGWLRDALKFLDYEMVHKSTWVGKTKLPEEFIKCLSDLKILDCVKIFEVTKGGTLLEHE